MTRVLLVEDNPSIVQINKRVLELEGFSVRAARTLEQARALFAEEQPDIIVLDLMLPDGSGVSFCKEIRSESDVPILILTALGDKSHMLEGLAGGGDDYLVKPYDLDVFVARVKALLRRSTVSRHAEKTEYGPILIDILSRRALLDGQDINLTGKELGVLAYLLGREGELCSPEEIYRAAWGAPSNDNLTVVRIHISALRRKLRLDSRTDIEIENVFKGGYRIVVRSKNTSS